MKNTVLFCTGLSGSGKSYFIQNILPAGCFYNLKSATTRPVRDGEKDGREYYFRDEQYFEKHRFATMLWVNEAFWKPGISKWLYGVPEFEIINNLGCNFTYDVIQPKYVRQMIDWFNNKYINNVRLGDLYDFRTLWFQPPANSIETVQKRQNMPNDIDVRRANTCNMTDFVNSGLIPDHMVVCNPQEIYLDENLKQFLGLCAAQNQNTK